MKRSEFNLLVENWRNFLKGDVIQEVDVPYEEDLDKGENSGVQKFVEEMFNKWKKSDKIHPHQDFFDMNKDDLKEKIGEENSIKLNDRDMDLARDKFLADVRKYVRVWAKKRV